jgi:glyoxylase-like metal-dependent hydrolase (beta-lactamase superfamily II)
MSRSSVVTLNLGVSTAYAMIGTRTVLVDTGPVGSAKRLLRLLRRAGVDPGSLSLIVLTHCHPDHAGGAAELRRRLGVPVAVHHAEYSWAAEGRSDLYRPIRAFGRVLRAFIDPSFPALTPDVVLHHDDTLDGYGIPATVLHTPGHTPGSITVLRRDSGDALVGDLLAGGFVRLNQPELPFLADNVPQLHDSVRSVLAAGPSRFLFGHGRPAAARSVLQRFGPLRLR